MRFHTYSRKKVRKETDMRQLSTLMTQLSTARHKACFSSSTLLATGWAARTSAPSPIRGTILKCCSRSSREGHGMRAGGRSRPLSVAALSSSCTRAGPAPRSVASTALLALSRHRSAPRGPYSNEPMPRPARHHDKSGENAECTDGGGSPGSDVLPRPSPSSQPRAPKYFCRSRLARAE